MDSNTREKGIISGGMPPPVPHRRLQTIRITERKGCVVLFKKAEQKRLVRREIQGGKGEAHCLYAISKGEGPEKSRFKMAATMTLDPGGQHRNPHPRNRRGDLRHPLRQGDVHGRRRIPKRSWPRRRHPDHAGTETWTRGLERRTSHTAGVHRGIKDKRKGMTSVIPFVF